MLFSIVENCVRNAILNGPFNKSILIEFNSNIGNIDIFWISVLN